MTVQYEWKKHTKQTQYDKHNSEGHFSTKEHFKVSCFNTSYTFFFSQFLKMAEYN